MCVCVSACLLVWLCVFVSLCVCVHVCVFVWVFFVRTLGQQSLWVLSNFSQQAQTVTITLTPNQATMLKPNSTLYDLLESHNGILVSDEKQNTTFTLTLDALSSAVLINKAEK